MVRLSLERAKMYGSARNGTNRKLIAKRGTLTSHPCCFLSKENLVIVCLEKNYHCKPYFSSDAPKTEPN